ncbi:MAG TPA: polysaccharide deacetylase family protein [Burkholderiaceae bacterium]
MRRWLALLLCALALPAPADEFKWPRGARLAVSLGYDDALASQLDIALPALNAHGLKASFYLTLANEGFLKRQAEWRKAAAQGHELGNHTLFHACSRSQPGREWVEPQRDLDKISVAKLRDEILLASRLLAAIDGKTERTLTLPCIDTKAGGEAILPAIRGDFVAIKAGPEGLTPDITTADPADIGTADPSGMSGAQLIELVEKAAAQSQGRALFSLTFHGVGGDYLVVSREAHAALLKHLAAHPERYWVDSFVKIMAYVKAAQGK